MGDPAGIGPEVTLRAIDAPGLDAGVLLLGDPGHWRRIAESLALEFTGVDVSSADEARSRLASGEPGPWLLPTCVVDPESTPGAPRPPDGRAAIECVTAGADLASLGEIDALATAPLNKDLVALHVPRFHGHTEYLAERAGVADPIMVFAGPRPHIALLTTHLPLATALTLVRRDTIARMLENLHREWSACFGEVPTIGVAALNPHAGERGRLGTEEARLISPAIHAARAAGIDATGPYPADSIFLQRGIDVILALYHDQGPIIAKRAPWPTVNLTLGLPYIRTSPDHGTAYDLVGTGRADPAAMRAALELASELAARRVVSTE